MDASPQSPRAPGRAAPGLPSTPRLVRRLGAVAPLLTLVACTTTKHAGPGHERPFEVSLVETRACPLPATLDGKATRMVGVKVRITSRHAGNVPANYFYGSLLTKDGKRWLAALPGCDPVLASRPLEPGESSEGFLNFALPKDARVDRIAYAPRLANSTGSERLDQSDLVVEVPVP